MSTSSKNINFPTDPIDSVVFTDAVCVLTAIGYELETMRSYEQSYTDGVYHVNEASFRLKEQSYELQNELRIKRSKLIHSYYNNERAIHYSELFMSTQFVSGYNILHYLERASTLSFMQIIRRFCESMSLIIASDRRIELMPNVIYNKINAPINDFINANAQSLGRLNIDDYLGLSRK